MLQTMRSVIGDRNRWPSVANRVVDWIAEHPTSPLGRLVALRYGSPPGGTPVSVFSTSDVRLLIAPVNYSGQARAWASAVAEHLGVGASTMALDVPGGFRFDADLIVPPAVFQVDHDWQRRQFEAVAVGATHLLIEAEEPPFGRLLGRDLLRQVEAIRQRGVDVAFIAHGTDVRSPARHVENEPWSHFHDSRIYTRRLERLTAMNRADLVESGLPVFVSTPDLLLDVPSATWCPVVVDVDRWNTPRVGGGGPLRVAHAPSVTAVKGTELITQQMERLDKAGEIIWRLVQGVASSDMPMVFAATDVLLDQFRIGSYGVAAVEAMAAGCVVVGHVRPEIRELVSEATGVELPLVEATPDTLESVIHELASDPARVERIREDGRQFVETVHDGRMSAAILGRWLPRGPEDG